MARAQGVATTRNGGWDSPPQRHPIVQVIIGVALGAALIAAMIWIVVFTDDNADRIPPPSPDGEAVHVED